jgi:maltose alpha-D-glucosyltransferase/alpha-amylase
MVTDEERDYMYEAYASDPRARINLGIRHRLAPLLGNNRRRIELMNGLLLSLPGTPVLYYGDEIGMGDNIYLGDRNGVRTPMQWSADRNAGFSRANPQKLFLPVIIDPEYHYEAVNVEAQQANPNSLLWWNKRLIALRRQHQALSRGTLEFLRPLNRRVLAFLRQYEDETILVVANLSRFAQWVELDLSAHAGSVPVELFGATQFPPITEAGYLLMLGPHSFLWFSLTPQTTRTAVEPPKPADLPVVRLNGPWEHLKYDPSLVQLEWALLPYVQARIPHRLPRTPIRRIRIRDLVPIPYENELSYIVVFDAEIGWLSTIHSWLPIALVDDVAAEALATTGPTHLIARADGPAAPGWICDSTELPKFDNALVAFMAGGRRAVGEPDAEIVGVSSSTGWPELAEELPPLRRDVTGVDGHSLIFGDALVLSRFWRPELSKRPELELGRWLTEQSRFEHAPRWLGALEYRRARENPLTLASVHSYLPNEGTAWQFTLDELSAFFDRTLALPEKDRSPPELQDVDFQSPGTSVAPDVMEAFGGFLNAVRRMAECIAELHTVLSAESHDLHFAPESFTGPYQRSLYQTLRSLTSQSISDLRQVSAGLSDEARAASLALYKRESDAYARFHRLIERPLNAWRMRIHGECHLANLLRTGKDFALIGFEWSSSSPERKTKRSPLRDVARLLHSFDFASTAALNSVSGRHGRAVGTVRPEDFDILAKWTVFWRRATQETFIAAYRDAVCGNKCLDIPHSDFNVLIDVFLLQASLTELRHEIADGSQAIGLAVETLMRYLDQPWELQFSRGAREIPRTRDRL